MARRVARQDRQSSGPGLLRRPRGLEARVLFLPYPTRADRPALERRHRRLDESEDDPKTKAALKLDKARAARIDGRWIKGKTTLPVALERIAYAPGEDEDGPCGSAEYIAPRLIPTRIVESRAAIDGRPYRKLKLVVGRHFDGVSVETFALDGGDAATAENQSPAAQTRRGSSVARARGSIACRQSLEGHGVDGDYIELVEPKMIGRRWMAVNYHVDGSCGGAHPFSGTVRACSISPVARRHRSIAGSIARVSRAVFTNTDGEAIETLTPAYSAPCLGGGRPSRRNATVSSAALNSGTSGCAAPASSSRRACPTSPWPAPRIFTLPFARAAAVPHRDGQGGGRDPSAQF